MDTDAFSLPEPALEAGRSRDPDGLAREALVALRANHPAVPPVIYELAPDGSSRLKPIVGVDLERLARSSKRTSRHVRARMLRALADTCLAVERAHRAGVVHAHLTPACIVIGELGELYVLGWGGAIIDGVRTGSATGAPGYAAPEQLTGGAIDARTDVFALGRMIGELADQDPTLEQLCARATAHEPAGRIATARELAVSLTAHVAGESVAAAEAHLRRAHAALGRGETDVALDELAQARVRAPDFDEPRQLITALVLSPVLSPGDAKVLEVEREEAIRRASRGSMWGYVPYFLFAPAMLWLGAGQLLEAALLVACVVLNMWVVYRRGYRGAPVRKLPSAIANALLLAVIAHVFTPFIAAPALAVATIMTIVSSPLYSTMRDVVLLALLFCNAVLGPFAAELLGWLPVTTTATEQGLLIQAPALQLQAGAVFIPLVMFVCAVIAASALLAFAMRKRAEPPLPLIVQAYRWRQLLVGSSWQPPRA